MNEVERQVVSPRPALKYALLASGVYMLITWVLLYMKVIVPDLLNFLMVLAVFIAGIVLTQIELKNSVNEDVAFERYWRYGNLSGFIIAVIVTLYHGVVLAQTAGSSGIFYFLGFSLMSKCLLGLVISAIVAFFISKT